MICSLHLSSLGDFCFILNLVQEQFGSLLTFKLYWVSSIPHQLYVHPLYLGSFSFWHLVSALQRLGSGQRSSGVWFFLFLSERSAPLAAKKHAIDAEDFLSAPWLPRQMRSCNGKM